MRQLQSQQLGHCRSLLSSLPPSITGSFCSVGSRCGSRTKMGKILAGDSEVINFWRVVIYLFGFR